MCNLPRDFSCSAQSAAVQSYPGCERCSDHPAFLGPNPPARAKWQDLGLQGEGATVAEETDITPRKYDAEIRRYFSWSAFLAMAMQTQ